MDANGSRLDRIEAMLERHATMIIDSDIRHHAALDRIEKMIDRQVLANEAAHDHFAQGNRELLTAQVLMNGALAKMTTAMETQFKEFDSRMVILESKMEETTDKLNGLIATVDGFVQRPPA
jgi:hypothetical protein